jgi:hypothetical protein
MQSQVKMAPYGMAMRLFEQMVWLAMVIETRISW